MKQAKNGLGPIIRTAEEVREWFYTAGMSYKEWAAPHGYNPDVVGDLLRGKSIGRRGQAHNVAVRLGMKLGTVNPIHEPGPDAKREAKP